MTLNPKLDPSCVLCLPFEEADGSIAYDQSLYNNNGTIYGATRTLGKIRKALYFDGVDDYVEIPNSDSLNSPKNSITISLWANPSEVEEFVDRFLFVSGYGFYSRVMKWVNTRQVVFGLGDTDNNYHFLTSTSFLEVGKWWYIACLYDGSKMMIFVNGELNSVGSTDVFTIDLTHGQSAFLSLSSNSFFGLIDEVRIYNRALSAKEIYEHYIYGIQSIRRGPIPKFRKDIRRKFWPEISV